MPKFTPLTRHEVTLAELLGMLLRQWRLVLGLPLLLVGLTLAASFVLPPAFTATVAFVPEPTTPTALPSNLAGLASQFGVTLGAPASQSPRFYGDVLRSRELMERVLQSKYQDPHTGAAPTDSVTLVQLLQIRGRDSADIVTKGVKKLGHGLSITVTTQTGIVTLSVESRYPTVAAAVANRFIEYLNAFNTHARQSQARARRTFVEGRMQEGAQALRNAEDELLAFLQKNRSWQQSPQLVFEQQRLQRQVDLRQQVYLTLNREFETAKIEEVNDTPVITVIDHAVPPARRSWPKRIFLTILSAIVGVLIGAAWALTRERLDYLRDQRDPEYDELLNVAQQARTQIRSFARTLLPWRTRRMP